MPGCGKIEKSSFHWLCKTNSRWTIINEGHVHMGSEHTCLRGYTDSTYLLDKKLV